MIIFCTVPIIYLLFFRFFELKKAVFIFTNEATLEPTNLRLNDTYITIYNTWMRLFILEIIPYFTILILNLAILRTIMKSSNFRRKFRNEEKQVSHLKI